MHGGSQLGESRYIVFLTFLGEARKVGPQNQRVAGQWSAVELKDASSGLAYPEFKMIELNALLQFRWWLGSSARMS